MADNTGTFIKLGIVAAVGYYAYKQGWLSSLGIGTSTTTVDTTAAAAAAAAAAKAAAAAQANAITGANTLAGIYARMVAAAPSGSHNVDQWNVYLASAGNLTPPDPMPIFTAAVSGFDRSQLLTAAQYWGVMAPALTAQQGLTGIGRIYAGLGAIADGLRYGRVN